MTERIPAHLTGRRKPSTSAAGRWLVGGAAVGGGLTLIATMAAAADTSTAPIPPPTVADSISVVRVVIPQDDPTVAPLMVPDAPRAPATRAPVQAPTQASVAETAPPVTESGGS